MAPDASHDLIRHFPIKTCDPAVKTFKQAIEQQYGCTAKFAQLAIVWEMLRGEIIEERMVHVFDLELKPEAARAYVWHSRSQTIVVLHQEGIAGPDDAVRSILLAERRTW